VSEDGALIALEEFDNAIYATSSDDQGTDVHDYQNLSKAFGEDLVLGTSVVEDGSQDDEDDKQHRLHDDCDLDQDGASFLLLGAQSSVDHSLGALDDEDFTNTVGSEKGGEDATWMHG
jgi:hypothetical protein